LSTGLHPDPLGELTTLPKIPLLDHGEGRGKGRWKGMMGRGAKGEERAGEKEGK